MPPRRGRAGTSPTGASFRANHQLAAARKPARTRSECGVLPDQLQSSGPPQCRSPDDWSRSGTLPRFARGHFARTAARRPAAVLVARAAAVPPASSAGALYGRERIHTDSLNYELKCQRGDIPPMRGALGLTRRPAPGGFREFDHTLDKLSPHCQHAKISRVSARIPMAQRKLSQLQHGSVRLLPG